MPKIYAILGGGDWADASVDHVILPDGLTIEEALVRYKEWYKNYSPKIENYMTLDDFIVHKLGGRRPNDDELGVVDEWEW